VIAVIGLAGWYVRQKDKTTAPATTNSATTNTTSNASSNKQTTFANPKKGAHFESSTPAHAPALAAVPVDVVIDFNFDLAGNSTIAINKDGKNLRYRRRDDRLQ